MKKKRKKLKQKGQIVRVSKIQLINPKWMKRRKKKRMTSRRWSNY